MKLNYHEKHKRKPKYKIARSRYRPRSNFLELRAGRLIGNQLEPKNSETARGHQGLEFSIVLIVTLCLGLLTAILSIDEEDHLREYLISAFDWSSTILAIVGIFYAVEASIGNSRTTSKNWVSGAAVLFVVFSITGSSAYLTGGQTPEVVQFATSSKNWSKRVRESTERLTDFNKALDIARSEYDSCARQRDALKIQAQISKSELYSLAFETGKKTLRLDSFCDYEKLNWEAISNYRNAADAELQIVTAQPPKYQER